MLDNDVVASIGFAEPERASRILASLERLHGLSEPLAALAPRLADSLRRSPDPDMALNNFERWFQTLTSKATYLSYLHSHPALLDILLTVCSTSQFFADILIQNPETIELLADPRLRERPKTAAELHREIATLIESAGSFLLKLDRLRMFKQREVLRIGVNDVMGEWSLEEVTRALSDFADACAQTAYEICHEELSAKFGMSGHPGLAVIGMGKLGGRELNYSSDIDLIFVHADEPKLTGRVGANEYLLKLSEGIINALSGRMTRGIVFRVDMRLRPEGKFGLMARSLSGCRAYYENWAENWEFQALMKARFIAGDAGVGEEFIRMLQPLVFRRFVLTSVIDEVRHNKLRLEKQTQAAGQWETNIKNGFGGIRDIEFTVQLLQLVHGGRRPRVRTGSTLEALERLGESGLLTEQEVQVFSENYRFLRTVEHRVQFLDERQTHRIPEHHAEQERLARRLRFPDSETFGQELDRRRNEVRAIFERRFLGEMFHQTEHDDALVELLDLLESDDAIAAAEQRLAQLGFREPERARKLLQISMVGTQHGLADPETRKIFREVGPEILRLASRSPEPDDLLGGIEGLALAVPNRAQLYVSFRESPEVLRRLADLAVFAPPMYQRLVNHQELLDLLFSDEIIRIGEKPAAEMTDELALRLRVAKHDERRMHALTAYARREMLRVGARDVWGEAEPDVTAADLSNLGDVLVSALLKSAAERRGLEHLLDRVAVIGMGKVGGRELGYGSDWDLVFVRDTDGQTQQDHDRLIEAFLGLAKELHLRGVPSNIDARLRPEGRFGLLSRSLDYFREYYETQSWLWERQALIKSRFVAGNPEIGARFIELARGVTYGQPPGEEGEQEIRHMKRRVETERLRPEDRDRDVKLGRGGLVDIEFTTQLLQMRHGPQNPALRRTGTLDALRALNEVGLVDRSDFLALYETYRYLYALRNRMFLMVGLPTDLLPSGRGETKLARSLGFSGVEAMARTHKARLADAAAVVDRLFWAR